MFHVRRLVSKYINIPLTHVIFQLRDDGSSGLMLAESRDPQRRALTVSSASTGDRVQQSPSRHPKLYQIHIGRSR